MAATYLAFEVRVFASPPDGGPFDPNAAMEAARAALQLALPAREVEVEPLEMADDGPEPPEERKPFPQELIDLPCALPPAEDGEED